MKKAIKLMISDAVFARMVHIVLKSSSYELIAPTEDDPEAVILTDDASFVGENNASVLYLLRSRRNTDCENVLIRPFLTEDLVRAVAAMAGDAEILKRPPRIKEKQPHLDKKTKRVIIGSLHIQLTEKEYLLFSLLYDAKGNIVTDAEIDEKVWENEVADDSNITAVYINYLRKKIETELGRKYILRERGVGYRIAVPAHP